MGNRLGHRLPFQAAREIIAKGQGVPHRRSSFDDRNFDVETSIRAMGDGGVVEMLPNGRGRPFA